MDSKEDDPVITIGLKGPVSLFDRLDRWIELQRQHGTFTTRPQVIRHALHKFLLAQERRQESKAARARPKKASAVRRAPRKAAKRR